jgi:HEAT repeat protein
VVAGCIDILNGTSVDERLLDVLAGPAAGSVKEGAEGGLSGYWPRVWALRGFLYAWSDDAVPALITAFADQSWRVREMAARVVAKRIVGEAFDQVVKMENDPTPRVRVAARRAVSVLVDHQA